MEAMLLRRSFLYSLILFAGNGFSNATLSRNEAQKIIQHPNWRFLDHVECGESYADKIIGGKDAELGQYPWAARIGYHTPENPTGVDYRCGGALISAYYVLTAGHCVSELQPGVRLAGVLLGEHDLTSEVDCRGSLCAPKPQFIEAVNVATPVGYNKPQFSQDIALVHLAAPAQFHRFVQPICLPRGEELSKSFIGDSMTVTGWGTVSMRTMDTATVLQTIDLPILPNTACSEYKEVFTITDEQLCAGAQINKDACGGDSGGPMSKVLQSNKGPKTYVLAVVSFGPDMCGTSMPGIYTSVPYFMNWILDNIQQ